MYHQQGRGHNGRLSGRTPGAVHRHVRRVRGDPRRLVQGPEGLARIQRGTQAGLVHPRALPPGHGRGGHEFPLPQLRAAFQRASVPDPRLLPLPDENDEGAYAHAFRLLDPLPGQHHSQRGKPGIGDKIPGGGGTVRAYSERFGFLGPCPPHGGRDHGYGGLSGPAGTVLFPLALGDDFSSGHRAGGRGSARGQQTGVPAHALGHGRPAGARGYGHPLRASFHRPFGLPALVRGPRGASAFLRPPLQPVRVPGRQRRKPAYVRETCA